MEIFARPYALNVYIYIYITIISKRIAEDGNKTRRGWQLAAPRIIQRRMQHDSTLFEGALSTPLALTPRGREVVSSRKLRATSKERKKKERKGNRKRAIWKGTFVAFPFHI